MTENIKKFNCIICNKNYKSIHSLSNHKRIYHNNQREPYVSHMLAIC